MKPPRLGNSLSAIAASLMMAAVTNAQAQWKYDEKAVAMLPEYCRYTSIYSQTAYGSMDPAQRRRWQQLMGRENFMHMHHYCRGLEHTNRALYLARTKTDRDKNLEFSIREFDYVLKNVKPDFAMLPEMHTKRGENLMRLGRAPEAIQSFALAIERKPDYWLPYAALSDYYKDQRDPKQAREWLEKGLSAASDAPPLKRRLAELNASEGRRKTTAE